MRCGPLPATGTTCRCDKHHIDICAACGPCKESWIYWIYCKFRPACLIIFMTTDNQRARQISSKDQGGNHHLLSFPEESERTASTINSNIFRGAPQMGHS